MHGNVPEYFSDENPFVSAHKQRCYTICPTKSSPGVCEEASPMQFCHSLPSISCLFVLLTTNLLARVFAITETALHGKE